MRVLGRKKDGSILMATDQEIIQNALNQEKSGIDPHYAFIDYKSEEPVTPFGGLYGHFGTVAVALFIAEMTER